MSDNKLQERENIDLQYQWKLEDIYSNNKEWEKDFQLVEEMLKQLNPLKGSLDKSSNNLLKALELEYALQEKMEKLYTYARMRRDENNANSFYQALTDRADNLNMKAEAEMAFLLPEILNIDEKKLKEFRNEENGLALYDFMFEELLRQKEHILSPKEEEIVARVGEIAQGADTIFRMLNNADLVFPKVVDEKGKEIELTHGNYIQLMESKDRRVRKEAFMTLYGSYDKLKNTLAATYSSSVKKDVFYATVRKYNSSLEEALFEDNVSVQVYDNLIETVHKNLDKLHRYVSLRKKILGLDEIHMYDLYVPMVKELEWEVPYEEAVEIVKEGLKPMGTKYQDILSAGLNEGWIDVYENKGKTSGAYSWGPYGVHPYVLLNYKDNLNNVFTIAHEMGHAIHSYFADKNQPYCYSHYTIFTAEVASTVNESLLMQYLLQKETNKEKKLYLLNYYLEQFRGTIYRQTMFGEFEKIVHEKAEAGEALTVESLCQIYRQLNIDYYGKEMVVDEEIDLEWARIPHFYSAFYVYKYATGFSAAVALSKRILENGEKALEDYLGFLKKGGSDYPLNLLKGAGVDMTNSKPIEEALQLFSLILDQMESLI